MQKILKLGFVGGGINSTIGQTHYIASQLDGKWKSYKITKINFFGNF